MSGEGSERGDSGAAAGLPSGDGFIRVDTDGDGEADLSYEIALNLEWIEGVAQLYLYEGESWPTLRMLFGGQSVEVLPQERVAWVRLAMAACARSHQGAARGAQRVRLDIKFNSDFRVFF